MVDLDILKQQGVSVETLKKTFKLQKSKDDKGQHVGDLVIEDGTRKPKVNRLVRRIRSRIQGGRDYNCKNYRIYQALDEAWDSPLKQITPTMLMGLLDKTQDPSAATDILKSWGVNPDDYIYDYSPDPKTPEKTIKRMHIPAFFPVRVPLAKAYTTIRWAKLVNDRMQVPHFKFEPAISNQKTRMRCEVITAAVEEMSNQYGYFDLEKQAILKMLKYGQQLSFPVEAWHTETQLVGKDSGYEEIEPGDILSEPQESDLKEKPKPKEAIETVVKEGIRYHLPHPARTFYDRAWYPSTFNTDSGAAFGGYWRVMRYSDIADNEAYYNLDVIRIGDSSWYTGGRGIFENVYRCQLRFPAMTAGEGTGDNNSEKIIGDGFYNRELSDDGILITEYFEKLNPKQYGLGEYDHEVWFRFVIAADDTIIYCEPLAYAPIAYYGYDADESNAIQSSMMLEILPFEIQLSNLFTQYIISVFQNLYNITLVDTDMVDQNVVDDLKRATTLRMCGFNILPFSAKELEKRQQNPRALYPERLPQVDTQSIANAMRSCFEMVERLLVMSPQEMGQAASHEQTAEESKIIATHSSSRLEFTGTAADRPREAIKRQCYEAKMAYGQDEFWAQVPADPELDGEKGKKILSDLGLTWAGQDADTKRVTVKATKTAVMYQKFVANRDGANRVNEREVAVGQLNLLTVAMGNPMTMQAIGPDQAIKLINDIARSSGFPRDFKLVNMLNNKAMLQQNNEEVLQQVQQMIQQLGEDVKGALQTVMQDNAKQQEQINELQQAVAPQAPAQPEMMPMPEMAQPTPEEIQDMQMRQQLVV